MPQNPQLSCYKDTEARLSSGNVGSPYFFRFAVTSARMGDETSQPGAPAKFTGQKPIAVTIPESGPTLSHPTAEHSRSPTAPQHSFTPPNMTHQQRTTPFDMTVLASTLPHDYYRAQPYHGSPRYTAPIQMPPTQYGPPGTMGSMPAHQYYAPQHPNMAQYYQPAILSQSQATMPPRPDMGYYPNPMVLNQVPQAPAHFYYSSGGGFPGQALPVQGQAALGQYRLPTILQHQDPRNRQSQHGGQEVNAGPASPQGNGVTGSRQSIVRGPPRKPRQSGHAIWVGNLPPQTDLMSLVHHVCKETEGLESLFLISKSNCAFANFKNEQACSAAQQKLHDSKFMTVRLVSRLRKSTVEGPAGATAPTGPAASTSQGGTVTIQEANPTENYGGETKDEGVTPDVVAASAPESQATIPPINGRLRQKDRFFVLKSLTVEDLELSVRTNIWATQSHNEEILNSAYKTSDNVYLVFSANKSGEYFGYARMASAINEDPAAAIEFAPSAQPANEVDLPKAIPTDPTEFAPKGRIIDDSARGTIFWEAIWDDKTASDAGQDDETSNGSAGGDTGSVHSGLDSNMSEPKAWGKPFRLEWLSTTRLPFFHTRGLRNSFNSNREVKIARDGTEIEPTVARTLIGKFYRAQGPALGMLPPVVPGGFRMQVPVTVGYPPMR